MQAQLVAAQAVAVEQARTQTLALQAAARALMTGQADAMPADAPQRVGSLILRHAPCRAVPSRRARAAQDIMLGSMDEDGPMQKARKLVIDQG